MQWRGEFAFGDVWLAFRGASADNRMHAHAALQLVVGHPSVTLTDESGQGFAGPGWAIRSGVRHALEPTPSLALVLVEPQSHIANRLLDRVQTGAAIAAMPAALVAALTQPLPIREIMQGLEGVGSVPA